MSDSSLRSMALKDIHEAYSAALSALEKVVDRIELAGERLHGNPANPVVPAPPPVTGGLAGMLDALRTRAENLVVRGQTAMSKIEEVL